MSTFGLQFQLIFEYLPQGIFILDTTGRIVYVNNSAVELIDAPVDAVLQLPLADFLRSSCREEFMHRFYSAVEGLGEPRFQMDAEYAVGSRQGLWSIDIRYISSEEHSPFVFAVLDDITSQRQGQQRLIREREKAIQETRTKSDFLANVSHEIRTPIHTIIGTSELLLDTELDVEQREYAGQIQFSADILLSLVNDVLDLSKIEAGKLSLEIIEFDLYQVIADAADIISQSAHKKGLELLLDCATDVPRLVWGDPLRIRQILVNFLSNALKFTSTGGISVNVRLLSENTTSCSIQIEVEDSGIGIPEAKLPYLFRAFRQVDSSTTRKYGGTGLGLSISKSLVKMMRGKIGVRSRLGRGSVFWVTIPFRRSDRASSLQNEPRSLHDKRALIIDDNRRTAAVIARYLAELGMTADAALDGRHAVAQMHQAAGAGEPYDVVLIDLLLAGMDGWQVAGEINSDTAINSTRLILMVPNGQLGADAKMKRLGWFDDYITKPVRVPLLYEKLQTVLLEDLDLPSLEPGSQKKGLSDASGDTDAASWHTITGTALLAEDHEVNRDLFRSILQHFGLQVVTAVDGQQAVELFSLDRFDIVFMDVQMPVMNGYTASSRIREMSTTVPIIGVTANALQGERQKCLRAGMSEYLPKPFKARDVYPLLQRFVHNGNDADDQLRDGDIASAVAGQDSMQDNNCPIHYAEALDTFLGKEDVLDRVLKNFCERGQQQLTDIEEYLRSDDFDSARIQAHGMKGSAAHLEGVFLMNAAAELEEACMDHHKGLALQHLKQVKHEFRRFTDAATEVLA